MALNLGDRPRTFASGEIDGRLVLSTHLDRDGERVSEEIGLRADEGVFVERG